MLLKLFYPLLPLLPTYIAFRRDPFTEKPNPQKRNTKKEFPFSIRLFFLNQSRLFTLFFCFAWFNILFPVLLSSHLIFSKTQKNDTIKKSPLLALYHLPFSAHPSLAFFCLLSLQNHQNLLGVFTFNLLPGARAPALNTIADFFSRGARRPLRQTRRVFSGLNTEFPDKSVFLPLSKKKESLGANFFFFKNGVELPTFSTTFICETYGIATLRKYDLQHKMPRK